MQDYILFIDTEGSGWPKNWHAPYADKKSWPYSVQIAWVVYTRDGVEIKREDHYIGDDDFTISPQSQKIHGIDRAFLQKNGELRQHVMMLLSDDLLQYQPLIVGHFMELDMHMIGADFYRAGIANLSVNFPTFCTMKSSTKYAERQNSKYLRLSELYLALFGTEQPGQHNAITDAEAAARCFFEMLSRNDINQTAIDDYNLKNRYDQPNKPGCALLLLGLLALVILLIKLL